MTIWKTNFCDSNACILRLDKIARKQEYELKKYNFVTVDANAGWLGSWYSKCVAGAMSSCCVNNGTGKASAPT